MAKFKVGDKVEDFQRYGIGEITQVNKEVFTVNFGEQSDRYTKDGKYLNCHDKRTLMLTGRPFNVGDKVVIGGEKGIIDRVFGAGKTPVRADFGVENIWITTDGRAWPGTPIIAEHDWEEESDSDSRNESGSHAAGAIEYRERNKGVDVSPGFAKDWPTDNGIEDVTVSQEEVRHIAEMHGKSLSGQAEIDILKKQHLNVKNALYLVGFDTYVENAAIICECVKSVIEKGGDFSLNMANELKENCNKLYRGY